MNGEHNPERDERMPETVPASELSSEINKAVQRLWELGWTTPKAGENTPALVAARQSRLSALLGRQADEQTKRIVRLTWGLAFLTLGLFAATIGLYCIARHTDERINQIHEIAEAQRHQEKQTKPGDAQKDGIGK